MKHESVCTWHFLIGLSEKGWNQQKSTSFSWWVLLDSKWNESATCSINHQPLQSGGKIDFSGTAWCYLLAWKIMWLHQLYWLHIQATYLVLIDGVYSDCLWVYFRDWIDKKKGYLKAFFAPLSHHSVICQNGYCRQRHYWEIDKFSFEALRKENGSDSSALFFFLLLYEGFALQLK